eukprot:Skav225025  [mRNA]  locus=scaffold2061:23977:31285:+ [translate_table: standard]
MACAVCGGDSPLPASVLGWRKSKRIQYHVAKFQSKDAEEVLRRYLNSLPELNVSEVQRYAIHVAAWLSTPNCAAKLQTVKLLCSYLEQLQASNADLCPCLTTGLKAIWQTRPDFVDGIDGPWARLQDVMPAEVFGTEGSNINTPWMAGNAKKAVRRLQKTIQVWRNTVGNERASYVEALEQEVQQLSFQKGSDSLLERKQLESIFRRAVAALSQPLFWSCQERGEELDQDSLEQGVSSAPCGIVITASTSDGKTSPRWEVTFVLREVQSVKISQLHLVILELLLQLLKEVPWGGWMWVPVLGKEVSYLLSQEDTRDLADHKASWLL